MAIKVGINGFGRIGRNTLRAAIREGIYEKIDYVAINDPGLTPENAAFVFKYDSVMGKFDGTVEVVEDGLVINGKKIKFFAEKDPANLPWKGIIPLAEMFKERLGVPVAVTNDANAAAYGEFVAGAAKGATDAVCITLGTGVGSGIVINGQLVYGSDGFAGELGHVVMDRTEKGRSCGCGRTGCLEAYCSATGVARTAREILATTDRPSLLRDKPAEEIESLDVSIAASKGDEVANEIFQFTGKMLGEACADFAAFSSPEAFIFFGGLCKAGDLIMKPTLEAMEANVLSIWKGKTKLLVSELKDSDAAVLGASALAWG